MATPVEHSSLGPSSWPRWTRCPGSVKAQESHPDSPGYEAAEGTVFHELMADCLEYGLDPKSFVAPGRDGKGRGLNVDGFWVEYDLEMCHSGQDGLDFVRSYIDDPDWRVFIETRVNISPWTLPGQFGTSDVVMVNIKERRVIIFDWKYGKEPVYPQANEQLYGYCLGSWKTLFGKLFKWDSSDIKVTLIIEQPRVPGAGGAWDTTMDRVLEFGEHAKRQALLSTSENAPRVAGPKQCRWCRARKSCGTFAEWNIETIGLSFDDLDDLDEAPDLPDDITPERRGYILKWWPVFKRWYDELHRSAYRDAEHGDPTPGHKLVDGKRPARKWREEDKHKAERRMVRLLGDAAYKTPELLTPKGVEDVVGKTRYREEFERFVDQGQPHPTLVPEEDSREAKPSIIDLFDDDVDD